MIITHLAIIIVLSYLLGAIPCGLIVSKVTSGVDIREYGSGKIGGTNVMRTVGKKAGIMVIGLDVAKGATAVIVAGIIVGNNTAMLGSFFFHPQIARIIAALMVMVGHNWSVFLRFRGGRGVASYFGSLIPLAPATALFGGEMLLVTAVSTRYMSIGSIVGVLATWCLLVPLTLISGFSPWFLVYGLVASGLIVFQHRDNIARLQNGTERKLGDRAEELQ